MRLAKRGKLIYDEDLTGLEGVFKDRQEAGEALGKACSEVLGEADLVYAIPRGGVPVAVPVAEALDAELDLLICRKLLIPWNREAGFGAVGPDGSVFVDRDFARYLGLSERAIREAVEEQLREISWRNERLRGGRGYPASLEGKKVVLVDDGVAAGYTMSAALRFVKARRPREAVVAVPTGHLPSLLRLSSEADLVICLNVRSGYVFAVADAYRSWRDLTDQDVLEILGGQIITGPIRPRRPSGPHGIHHGL